MEELQEESRLKKLGVVLAVGLFLVFSSLLPVARHTAATTGVEVGDYWTYEAGGEEEGFSITVKVKQKVIGTEGSGASEAFVIKMTGSGDYSGNLEGTTVSGDVDITGSAKRLKSNFSMISQNIELKMDMKLMGESVTAKLGISATYTPAYDDYIGDNNPGHGGTVVSRSTVVSTIYMDMEVMGQHINDTETMTEQVVLTMVVGSSNQTVSVPAGSFDCYKVTYDSVLGSETSHMTYYYSDEAGNYVNTEGTTSSMADMFGAGELVAYSYGGKGSGGTSSLFSGTNLLIIIVVIVAVLVVVSLVLMMRKRGKAVAPMPMQMPPPEMGAPPPPPPGA